MKKIVKIFAILCLIVVSGIFILASLPRHMPWDVQRERDSALAELPLAKERWNNANLVDYDIDVIVHNSFSLCLYRKATLYVRDGELDRVVASSLFSESEFQEILDYEGHDCEFEEIVPTHMLNRVEQKLEKPLDRDYWIKVRFDSQYGFVKEYRVEAVANQIDHCCISRIYSNLQIVDREKE